MRFFSPIIQLAVKLSRGLVIILSFMLLVIVYSLKIAINSLALENRKTARFFGGISRKFDAFYERISFKLDFDKSNNLSRSYLIELAFRNMQAKKTRTIVTIGGMAIGIAFIVFLVSVGYGLQFLVTSRVARLEELQQAEVFPGLSDELSLNDEVLSRLDSIPGVKSVLPLISVVGRVSFQDSVSDLAVYGVTTDYLTSSAIQPVQGTFFESHEVAYSVSSRDRQGESDGAGEQDESGQPGAANGRAADSSATQETPITFTIANGAWLRVRSQASTVASISGYTRRVQTNQEGTQVVGSYYSGYSGPEIVDDSGERQALWIKSEFSLWRDVPCATSPGEGAGEDTSEEGGEEASSNVLIDPDCQDEQYVPLRDNSGEQVIETGYTAQISVSISGSVLGETTQIAQGTLPIINLATSSAEIINEDRRVIPIPARSLKQAVVNRAVLSVIGINEQEAVGRKITLTFVAVGDLIDGEADRIESAPTEYTIVGVTPEEGTPVVFVPFIELRALGITKMSRIKVIADDKDALVGVRTSIESMGYGTVSVVDTVSQINSLFSYFRLILIVIGMVALSVATLGMFNTLTVSLLERTREVGLMKAMGMKSEEVRELFLTESMIMGFYGGVLGLIIGFVAGKLLSLLLSSIAITSGIGFIDVSVVPLSFALAVVVLSLVVGILTGFYPAKRATKISALNALRYE
jgi:ABC-type lipoprotein release transport system permease subunit